MLRIHLISSVYLIQYSVMKTVLCVVTVQDVLSASSAVNLMTVPVFTTNPERPNLLTHKIQEPKILNHR